MNNCASAQSIIPPALGKDPHPAGPLSVGKKMIITLK